MSRAGPTMGQDEVLGPIRWPDWLDKRRSVARPGFNRWLAIPCAVAVHLAIGTAYGFGVFIAPLSRAIGVGAPIACPAGATLWRALTATDCDWRLGEVSLIFSLLFIVLGGSAALLGGWVERVGPRVAGTAAALCWSGGHVLGALGVWRHELWVVLLGLGGLGGVGLGLGYILPVSTLMRWFPDRRGLAGGLAVMGFGGGATIGAPLAAGLMARFAGLDTVGVAPALLVLAALNLLVMMAGALLYRVPPPGWRAPGPVAQRAAPPRSMGAAEAVRTRRFWLLWGAMAINTAVGMGVLGWAAPMFADLFGTGRPASAGAGFTALLAVFNVLGRLWWPWLSDRWGRPRVFAILLGLGVALYAALPTAAAVGRPGWFAGLTGVAISLFGGGFALLPAFVADLFGPDHVSAIQGRLLTAWSVAALLGPALIAALHDTTHPAVGYSLALYVFAALLAVGFLLEQALPRRAAG